MQLLRWNSEGLSLESEALPDSEFHGRMSGGTFEKMAEGNLIAEPHRRRDVSQFLIGRHQQ